MKYLILRILIFGIINFIALGIGSKLMGSGATSEWYSNLNKAPWTPPGWAFGVAWTTIMICFSVYMAELWNYTKNTKSIFILFSIQWILNVIWNPSFFKYHYILLGLIIIILLSLVIAKLFFYNLTLLKYKSMWLLPYLSWLLIATSLNAYIFLKN